MVRRSVYKRAQDLFIIGDVAGAEKLLRSWLDRKPKETWAANHAAEYLWLGHLMRRRGDNVAASRIFQEIVDTNQADTFIRAKAMAEIGSKFGREQDFASAHYWLERAQELLDPSLGPGEHTGRDKAMAFLLSLRCVTEYAQHRFKEAAETAGLCHDYIIAVDTVEDYTKVFINNYLNLFNCHLALGNIDLAREYLLLARAKILSLATPYAHGLVQFFENLATFNLFTAGSPQMAIDSLMQISEQVATNFAEFRRVFDFFSSLIVQLHEGKIDMEEIREQIKAYGDDPLIKAYIPTLLYGAPPPGDESGDDDIPSARLTD